MLQLEQLFLKRLLEQFLLQAFHIEVTQTSVATVARTHMHQVEHCTGVAAAAAAAVLES
jgi:hypothetical protein